MHATRWMKLAVMMVLLGCGTSPPGTDGGDAARSDAARPDAARSDAGSPLDAAAPDAGAGPADPLGWAPTASLTVARSAHTATRLADGRVLIVGGEDVVTRDPFAAVDIFDPVTETITPAAPLPAARTNHAAVRLDDGRVLVMGGGRSAPIGAGSGIDVTSSALLYDPATDTWAPTGDLLEGRSHFTALRMPSGRVLVAGGTSGRHEHGSTCTGAPDCGPLGDTLATAELYDPATGTFTATGSMREARTLHTLEVLASGEAIAIAGMNDYADGFATTELYDEDTGAWSEGPSLASEARFFHASAILPSGRLLVGGGKLPNTRMLASTDILDPAADATPTAPLTESVTLHRFVRLASERILAVGGFHCPIPCGPVAHAIVFDEPSEQWVSLGALALARSGHTATLLDDGRVLVCGGFTSTGGTASCELSTSE